MQKDVVKLKSPKLYSKRASYITCLETDVNNTMYEKKFQFLLID